MHPRDLSNTDFFKKRNILCANVCTISISSISNFLLLKSDQRNVITGTLHIKTISDMLIWNMNLHVIGIIRVSNARIFWSPESLRWPIAIDWRPSSFVVRRLFTSSAQELLGKSWPNLVCSICRVTLQEIVIFMPPSEERVILG